MSMRQCYNKEPLQAASCKLQAAKIDRESREIPKGLLFNF